MPVAERLAGLEDAHERDVRGARVRISHRFARAPWGADTVDGDLGLALAAR